jgi:hypothetical protein
MLWLGWSGILALAAQVLGGAVRPRKGGPPTSWQTKNVSATCLLLCAWLCSPTLLLRNWLISLTNPIVHQAALVVYLAEFQTFNVLVWNFAALLRLIKCQSQSSSQGWRDSAAKASTPMSVTICGAITHSILPHIACFEVNRKSLSCVSPAWLGLCFLFLALSCVSPAWLSLCFSILGLSCVSPAWLGLCFLFLALSCVSPAWLGLCFLFLGLSCVSPAWLGLCFLFLGLSCDWSC